LLFKQLLILKEKNELIALNYCILLYLRDI